MATVNILNSFINLCAKSPGVIPSIPTLAIPQLLEASAGVFTMILGILRTFSDQYNWLNLYEQDGCPHGLIF